MPFKPNADNVFPVAPADVEIRFTGLLLLIPTVRADAGTNCVVGALQASAHSLKISVRDKGTLAEVPTAVPITFPMTISSADAGVTKFVSTPVAVPFPGIEEADPNKIKDFRWSVDLKALHQNSSPATSSGRLRTVVTLKDGLLFTAGRTEPDEHAIHLVPPVGQRKCLNRIATETGAYIKLAVGQKLNIEWDNQGARKLELPTAATSGLGYTIQIENLPTNSAKHDDFDAYYQYAIDTVDQHFKLNVYNIIRKDSGAGVDAPCMPASSDGDGRY